MDEGVAIVLLLFLVLLFIGLLSFLSSMGAPAWALVMFVLLLFLC